MDRYHETVRNENVVRKIMTKQNIEKFIDQYDGTAIGQSVKNMYENGTDYEMICEYADIEYEDDEI